MENECKTELLPVLGTDWDRLAETAFFPPPPEDLAGSEAALFLSIQCSWDVGVGMATLGQGGVGRGWALRSK